PTLAKKPQIVVLTKQDAVPDSETIDLLKKQFKKVTSFPLFVISAVAHMGVDALVNAMFETLDKLPQDDYVVDVIPDLKALVNDDSQFEIHHKGKSLIVQGGKLDRLVRVTDFRNPSATRRVLNIFKAMGVFEELRKAGVHEGQTVIIGGFEFEY